MGMLTPSFELSQDADFVLVRIRLPHLKADEGEFYVFELIGLTVEEEGGRELGVVIDVLPTNASDILELDTGILLPLVEECVLEVDLEGERILVAPGFADADTDDDTDAPEPAAD